MNITIDVQPLLGQKSGVGYYISGLIQGLAQLNSDHVYRLAFFDFKNRAGLIPLPSDHFKKVSCRIPGRMIGLLWKSLSWPLYSTFFGMSDIYHFPNFVIRPLRKGKKVVTIHDISFVRYPQFTEPKNLKFLNSKIKETLEIADEIIVDSKFTKSELLNHYHVSPERVHDIHLGLSAIYCPSLKKKEPIILFVGTIEPRKNIETLLKAYQILIDKNIERNFRLRIVGGKGWLCDGIFDSIRSHPHCEKIDLVGYVSDEELVRHYQEAEVFVYPSFYEGFGLPPLEAMACGVPVIAARAGSLPEVLEDAAYWIDPNDPEALARAIGEILCSARKKQELINKGIAQSKKFSWLDTARKTLDVYQMAADR